MSLELDATAGLQFSIGEHVDKLSAAVGHLEDSLAAGYQMHAVPLSVTAGIAAPAAGPAVLDLGGPTVGRYWELTTFAVIGADDHTLVAGTTAALYAGGGASSYSLADLIIPGAIAGTAQSVPLGRVFGRRQLIIMNPAHVLIVVAGAAGGQALTGTARGWDRDVTELPQR